MMSYALRFGGSGKTKRRTFSTVIFVAARRDGDLIQFSRVFSKDQRLDKSCIENIHLSIIFSRILPTRWREIEESFK